jgi:hypothetical protein
MSNKLKAGDTYTDDNGNVYRVFDDGRRLRLWLISQPVKRDAGVTQVAQTFDEELAELRALDATYAQASGRWGR